MIYYLSMKLLVKTSIITLVALFATSSFAYSFEHVEMSRNLPIQSNNSILSQNLIPVPATYYTSRINSDSAIINGGVASLGNFEQVETFFVFGKSLSLVQSVDNVYNSHASIQEQGQDLRKTYTYDIYEYNYNYNFQIYLSSLDPNEVYYYSTCIEFENNNRLDITCSNNFQKIKTYPQGTHFEQPRLSRNGADQITSSSAVLSGEVEEMNDATLLKTFFIFGTDDKLFNNNVEGIYKTYNSIPEQGQLMRKSYIHNIYSEQEFSVLIKKLNSGKEYRYTVCGEFVDLFNNSFIKCDGSTQEFETLEGLKKERNIKTNNASLLANTSTITKKLL